MKFNPLTECPESLTQQVAVLAKADEHPFIVCYYTATGNDDLHLAIVRDLLPTVDYEGIRYFKEASTCYMRVAGTETRESEYDVAVLYRSLTRNTNTGK